MLTRRLSNLKQDRNSLSVVHDDSLSLNLQDQSKVVDEQFAQVSATPEEAF